VPIGRIYDAFDPESHRVYRRAMERSRGGLVTLADLVAALAERHPGCSELIGSSASFLRTDEIRYRERPHGTPQANSPELRAVLRRAYALAEGHPGVTRITPETLNAALVEAFTRPLRQRLSPGTALQDIPIGPASRGLGSRREAMPGPLSGASEDEVEEAVLELMRLWLKAQAIPAGTERDRALDQVAAVAQAIPRRLA
jgi:hypothetical protein